MANGTSSRPLKIVLTGDTLVGKSAMMHRYLENTFVRCPTLTIGVGLWEQILVLDGKTIKLLISEIPGIYEGGRFESSLVSIFYRDASGFIFLYDVTKERTLDSIDQRVSNLEKYAPANIRKMVIGNKCDMTEQRKVSREYAEQIARERGMLYTEMSVKTGDGVQEAIHTLVRDIMQHETNKTQTSGKSKQRRSLGKNKPI